MGDSAEYELVGASALLVYWRLADGGKLTLVANLGDTPATGDLHYTGTAIFVSQPDLPELIAAGSLPPWCAAWFIAEVQV
jgi:1,4-alpha-glucan branching enzyme/maltooligosyltrehalose trehalohydrolase